MKFVLKFGLLLMLFLAMTAASSTIAQEKGQIFSCTFTAGPPVVHYSVDGGLAGKTYHVVATTNGCASIAGSVSDLTGATDSKQFQLSCGTTGSGTTTVKIYGPDSDLIVVYTIAYTCTSGVNCIASATIHEDLIIPTLTEWGMILFGVVLLGLMTYFVVRRRRTSNIAAA